MGEGRRSSIPGIQANRQPVHLLDLQKRDLTAPVIRDKTRTRGFWVLGLKEFPDRRDDQFHDAANVENYIRVRVVKVQMHVIFADKLGT